MCPPKAPKIDIPAPKPIPKVPVQVPPPPQEVVDDIGLAEQPQVGRRKRRRGSALVKIPRINASTNLSGLPTVATGVQIQNG